MSERSYTLQPRDLLFLRDARPMGGSDAGLGANWSRPDQLWNALINTFHRNWPERQDWEGDAHIKRNTENKNSSDRFGALKTAGPFPTTDGKLYYPCPLDIGMSLVAQEGTNLPHPLTHTFRADYCDKRNLPQWISEDKFKEYLSAKKPDIEEETDENKLFDTERNIGIAIDAETHTAIESKLYQAEYLRLREGVKLAFSASCNLKPKGKAVFVDAFEKLGESVDLILGGQQGVVSMLESEFSFARKLSALVDAAADGCASSGDRYLLRWTLLTPALFPALNGQPGGWLPSWVDESSGKVMLPRQKVKRQPGERRIDWRARVKDAPKFEAKLIAARIGKAFTFSGWDLQTGPKPTVMAVPAGSSYVFECMDVAEYDDLCNALNPPVSRSTLMGEKGFGLGVCSMISKK